MHGRVRFDVFARGVRSDWSASARHGGVGNERSAVLGRVCAAYVRNTRGRDGTCMPPRGGWTGDERRGEARRGESREGARRGKEASERRGERDGRGGKTRVAPEAILVCRCNIASTAARARTPLTCLSALARSHLKAPLPVARRLRNPSPAPPFPSSPSSLLAAFGDRTFVLGSRESFRATSGESPSTRVLPPSPSTSPSISLARCISKIAGSRKRSAKGISFVRSCYLYAYICIYMRADARGSRGALYASSIIISSRLLLPGAGRRKL